MNTGNYIKINTILQRVYSIVPNSVELNRSDVVEWVWEAVSEFAEKGVFYELQEFIPIRDNKAVLPSNIEGLIAVSYVHDEPDDLDDPAQYEYNQRILMDTASEPFMTDANNIYISGGVTEEIPRGYRYTIKNGYIYTTFNEGIIQIEYVAFPTDENGEPLVPKTRECIEAVKWYIIYQIYTRQFYKDSQLGAQMQYAEQQWIVYGNKARVQMLTPNEAKMHEIYQNSARIVPLGLWRNARNPFNSDEVLTTENVTNLYNPTV